MKNNKMKVFIGIIICLSSVNLFCQDYEDVKILWWEDVDVVLNLEFISKMKEEEKAVLALLSTYAGGECIYDEDTRLECSLTSALNLGYQCSEEHLEFVKKWFLKDYEVFSKINNCYSIPYSATNQFKFSEIIFSRNDIRIQVLYKIQGVRLAEEYFYNYEVLETFEIKDGYLYKINEEELLFEEK
jgi:hypothetical protein